MRVIKFRAWDSENRQMLDVQELNFEDCFYGGGMQIKTTMYNDYFDYREMPLMQYTGLKDKNGFEIYEGDIVKVHYIGGDGTENNKVIFYRGTFCLDYSKDYKPLLNELNHCCEIIGNIYENENLLDKAGD